MRLAVLLLALLAVRAAHALKEAPLKGRVLRPGHAQPTSLWTIKLAPGVSPLTFGQEHGLAYLRPVKGLPGFHVFEGPDPEAAAVDSLHQTLGFSRHVEFYQQEHARQRETRRQIPRWAYPAWPRAQLPSQAHARLKRERRDPPSHAKPVFRSDDPAYSAQWHLHGAYGPLVHVNAEAAWNQGVTGRGVSVAIVDDGCNHASPELKNNYNAALSWNFNGGDQHEPSPYTTDGHGTAAAGVCCAEQDNGICGSGVAPDADLVCIRLIAEPSTDLMEAEALVHQADTIRVYSNSWGPADTGRDLQGPGFLTKAALKRQFHRNGTVYVWAGGNGRMHADNGNYDGYANDIHTIAVGAHSHEGHVTYYSEDCACLFVSAPSSDSSMGITTADLQGQFGSTSGDCRSDFGGTSSAAPLVAGVIANLLEKHPGMRARNIMHTLAKGASKINPEFRDWSHNSRGYHHSHAYGFGHPDLALLLEAAPAFLEVPALQRWVSGAETHRRAIPKASIVHKPFLEDPNGALVVAFEVSEALDFVEQVELQINYAHARRGDVRVSLLSPEGVVSQLALRRPDSHRDTPAGGWTFSSVRHWGERPQGNWRVLLDDAGYKSGGHLLFARLVIYGY